MTHKRLADSRELLAAVHADVVRLRSALAEKEKAGLLSRRAPAPSPAPGESASGQGYGSIFAACADRLAWARVTGPDGSAKPCSDMEAIRAVHALLDDHDMLKAEAQKSRAELAAIRAEVERLRAAECIDVVFDGPPSHESGRFVEVEDMQGRSINAGEWIDRKDGLWALRLRGVASVDVERVADAVRRDVCSHMNRNGPILPPSTVFVAALRTALGAKEGT